MELVEARVALEAMCTRCINHEQCLGTGCQPKNELKKTIEEAEVYKKAYELLIKEVSLERWYCDEKQEDLFKYYLLKAREDDV